MDNRADGTTGSYTLQAHLMKRVFELVDIVDVKTTGQLRRQRDVPMLPLVRTSVNTAIGIGEGPGYLPDVRLGVVRDAEVSLVVTNLKAGLCPIDAPLCAWQDMCSTV